MRRMQFNSTNVSPSYSSSGTRGNWQESVFGWNVLCLPNRCKALFDTRYVVQSSNIVLSTYHNCCLLTDYVSGGELFTHLYKREHFSEDEVRIYIAEIVLAIEQLHKLNIIYRDIKLENILLDADGYIVITDFGLSKELTEESNGRSYSFCGTIEYMAPGKCCTLHIAHIHHYVAILNTMVFIFAEVVRGGKAGHDIAVDWWSVGVLCYELLTGASPFTVDSDSNSQNEISKRILKTSPPMPPTIQTHANNFITQLLNKNPAERLGKLLFTIDCHRMELLQNANISPLYC